MPWGGVIIGDNGLFGLEVECHLGSPACGRSRARVLDRVRRASIQTSDALCACACVEACVLIDGEILAKHQ